MSPVAARAAIPNPMLAAALALAAQGLRVYPAHSVKNGRCSCGCDNPTCKTRGKHPHILEWQNKATTDERQIRAWWTKWPDANIGLATGKGLVVVEGDTGDGKDGPGYMHEHPELFPETVTQITGSGSTHRLYDVPAGVIVKNDVNKRIGHGCDIRGDGGFIIAAPSSHRSAIDYAWLVGHAPGEIKIAAAPPALLELLVPPEKPPASVATSGAPVEASGELAEQILAKYVTQAGGTGRNSAGFDMACQLRDNGFGEWDAETYMLRYQRAVAGAGNHPYTEEEARASLASAYSYGARQPWHQRAASIVEDPEPAPATPLQDATVPDEMPALGNLDAAIEEASIAGHVAAMGALIFARAEIVRLQQLNQAERAGRLLVEARVLELEAKIAEDKALKLNKGLNKGAREVYSATVKVLAEQGAAPGVEVSIPLAQVGAIALQSKSTVARHLDNFKDAGLITSRTATQTVTNYIPAPEGSGRKWQEVTRRQQVRYITPTEAFYNADTVFSRKRHGGARTCNECGSDDIEVKTVRYCRCRSCGRKWQEGAAPATPLQDATVPTENSENGTLCDPQVVVTLQPSPTPLINQGNADYVPPWERTVERKKAAATRLNVARFTYDAPALSPPETPLTALVEPDGLLQGEPDGAPLPEYDGPPEGVSTAPDANPGFPPDVWEHVAPPPAYAGPPPRPEGWYWVNGFGRLPSTWYSPALFKFQPGEVRP